jgi:4-diphosphocytidyl-2-C-methyl-D-erythritol kinase
MITFPYSKINLGLKIVNKRIDGFHNIESVFLPIPLFDSLEFGKSTSFSLKTYGNTLNINTEENILYRAWILMNNRFNIPPVDIFLIKNIPFASGLGGASADAAFFVKEINSFFNLGLSLKELSNLVLYLGSDCNFFLFDKPAYVTGRGEQVVPIDFNLTGFYLMLIVPDFKISTKYAFNNILIKNSSVDIKNTVLSKDFKIWQQTLKNDFEAIIPKSLMIIKDKLYESGALYASLTGSGSAFYGIFKTEPKNINIAKSLTFILKL